MSIQVGVGAGKGLDPYQAGRDAANKATEKAKSMQPDLTIVFSSVIFDQEQMLNGVRSVVGGSSLVGCSSAGEITNDGPDKRSVAVLTIKSDTLKCTIGLGKEISSQARKAGQEAARQAGVSASQDRHFFMMMPDGLKGNAADVIRGIQEVLGTSFPIVGGSAGDDFLFRETTQYYNEQILVDAVPGVLFSGDISVGIGVRHGWCPVGKLRRVTKAKANVIKEIDGEPAIEIYQEYFDKAVENLIDKEPLPRMTTMYPLGMTIPGEDEYLLRNALRVNRQGELICAGEIPQGSEVRLMIGSEQSIILAAKNAANRALANIGNSRIKFVILFDSISRSKLLGRRNGLEIDAVKDILGWNVPLIGFYCYGEQAPLRAEKNIGQSYFHNESIVVIAIGEKDE
ncbi:MAG: FIST N-terminal domain-containing protein [Candidatus Omnitrophota bacterium]|nr:FIST N-terminal domain-containing protein [Candidatus Omnitrophota bacterium]